MTLTAVVQDPTGAGTPTGSVQFFSGTTGLGTATLDDTGTATIDTTALPLGAGPSAVYSGDSNYATTSSTTAITVMAVAPPVLTSNADPATVGQDVTLTATLPVRRGPRERPSVSFDDNGQSLVNNVELSASPSNLAMVFYGSSTFATLPDSLKFTSGDFTISQWFMPDGTGSFQYMLSRGYAWGDQQGDIDLKISALDGNFEFEAKTAGGQWLFGWDIPVSALNRAAHGRSMVPGNHRSQRQQLHVVDQRAGPRLQASDADISDADDTNPILVGAMEQQSGGPGDFFQGELGELDIFDRAVPPRRWPRPLQWRRGPLRRHRVGTDRHGPPCRIPLQRRFGQRADGLFRKRLRRHDLRQPDVGREPDIGNSVVAAYTGSTALPLGTQAITAVYNPGSNSATTPPALRTSWTRRSTPTST